MTIKTTARTIITNACDWSGNDIEIEVISDDLMAGGNGTFELYDYEFTLARITDLVIDNDWRIERWEIRGKDWPDALGSVSRDVRKGKTSRNVESTNGHMSRESNSYDKTAGAVIAIPATDAMFVSAGRLLANII